MSNAFARKQPRRGSLPHEHNSSRILTAWTAYTNAQGGSCASDDCDLVLEPFTAFGLLHTRFYARERGVSDVLARHALGGDRLRAEDDSRGRLRRKRGQISPSFFCDLLLLYLASFLTFSYIHRQDFDLGRPQPCCIYITWHITEQDDAGYCS